MFEAFSGLFAFLILWCLFGLIIFKIYDIIIFKIFDMLIKYGDDKINLEISKIL